MPGLYSSIATALNDRLKAATAEGKPLADVDYQPYPIGEIKSTDDVPTARMDVPSLTERFQRGGLAKTQFTIPIGIGVDRELGAPGLLELYELVADVLENDASGNPDACLGGLLRKPMEMSLTTPHANTVSINGFINVTLFPRKVLRRGKRRTT